MSKLKASRYLKNNKKQAAILIVSFGLYFALLYGVHFFVNPMNYTDEEIYTGNARKIQSVYLQSVEKLTTDLTLGDQGPDVTAKEKIKEVNRAISTFAKELEQDDRIDHVLQCSTYAVRIMTFTGSTAFYIPLVDRENAKMICDYMDTKLIKGTYPQEPGDIVMDERMVKNLGLHIGDTLENHAYKVCGILKSKSFLATGMKYEESLTERNLFFLDQGTITNLTDFFAERGWEASMNKNAPVLILTDYENGKSMSDQFKAETEKPLGIMSYIITFVMGVVLYFVYQLHVKNRYEEWCLYRSLGYSQRDIFLLAFREYGFCLLGSILLALMGVGVILLVGGMLMEQKGIVFHYWMPNTALLLLYEAILLSGILQIPVFLAMRHITTIDAIEDDI